MNDDPPVEDERKPSRTFQILTPKFYRDYTDDEDREFPVLFRTVVIGESNAVHTILHIFYSREEAETAILQVDKETDINIQTKAIRLFT